MRVVSFTMPVRSPGLYREPVEKAWVAACCGVPSHDEKEGKAVGHPAPYSGSHEGLSPGGLMPATVVTSAENAIDNSGACEASVHYLCDGEIVAVPWHQGRRKHTQHL